MNKTVKLRKERPYSKRSKADEDNLDLVTKRLQRIIREEQYYKEMELKGVKNARS